MKKLYLAIAFVALCAFNANAFDLVNAANKVAEGANETSAAIESSKAKAAENKAAREKAAAEKKAAVEKKVADKKVAVEKKLADKKAKADAKNAERAKAVNNAKDSLNNLKGAFTN